MTAPLKRPTGVCAPTSYALAPVRTVKGEHVEGFRCIDCGDPLPRMLALCAALRCVDCEDEYRRYGWERPLAVFRERRSA